MNTIETELINSRTINGEPFSEVLHKSLIAHRIITNPRVIKCGTYYSKEQGTSDSGFNAIIRRNVQYAEPELLIKEKAVIKRTNGLPQEDGFVYMVTGTLRHRKQDSLSYSKAN